jgi:phosphate/sulfate permease
MYRRHHTVEEASMDIKVLLAIIACVFAIPVGLVLAALLAPRRSRIFSLLGAIIGAVVTAAGVWYYVRTQSVEGLSYALGAFLACAIGAVTGGLLVDFLFSLGDRRPTTMSPLDL